MVYIGLAGTVKPVSLTSIKAEKRQIALSAADAGSKKNIKKR